MENIVWFGIWDAEAAVRAIPWVLWAGPGAPPLQNPVAASLRCRAVWLGGAY